MLEAAAHRTPTTLRACHRAHRRASVAEAAALAPAAGRPRLDGAAASWSAPRDLRARAIGTRRATRHDRAFHRRRAGRGRPHHRARTRPARALPGLPLCRLDRAAPSCCSIARRARASSTPRRCRSTRSKPSSSRRTRAGHDVARLHSGDLSVWSALAEQLRRLERHGIPYTLTPGVPAFAAAAAALGRELTMPEVAQSVVLTRMPGRASRMPAGETLAAFAATGATLAIHLAIHALAADRRGAHAVLRRRLPGRHRGAGLLARRAHRARHAGDIDGEGRGRADRAHRADPGRPRAGGGGFSRKRALRSRTISGRFTGARRLMSWAGKSVLADQLRRRGRTPRSPARCRPGAAPRAAVRQALRGDMIAERDAFGARHAANASAAVLAARMRAASASLPPASARVGEHGEVDRAALGMQVEQPLRELGHLGDAAGDGDARHRMRCGDI